MIISIEDSLVKLYNNLKGMGYDIYRFSDNVVSDVVIYSGLKNHFSALNSSAFVSSSSPVLLIDGDNKDGSAVAGMIENKAYSSLF